MELIPILSTIILVATISTFLLAIGAYILYKVRERKGQAAVVAPPAEVEAELVTPAAAPAPQPVERERIVPQPVFVEPVVVPSFQRQPAAEPQQRASQGPSPAQPRPQPYNSYRPQNTAGAARQQKAKASSTGSTGYAQRGYQGQGSGYRPLTQEEKLLQDSKFLKYTSEGYVPAKEDKDTGALKWR